MFGAGGERSPTRRSKIFPPRAAGPAQRRSDVAVDPRRTSSAQWAERWAGLDVGTDIVLANTIARELIAAGLAHTELIENATSGCPDRCFKFATFCIAFTAPGEAVWTLDRSGSVGFCPHYGYDSRCVNRAPSAPSPVWDEDVYIADGTSYANALAAGVAALAISANPSTAPVTVGWGRGPELIEWILQRSARDLGTPGKDDHFGWGLPQADLAVAIANDLGEMIFFSGFESGTVCGWTEETGTLILCP